MEPSGRDASEALDTVGEGDAWRDERLEGLEYVTASELEGANLDDGILLGMQAGRLRSMATRTGCVRTVISPSWLLWRLPLPAPQRAAPARSHSARPAWQAI